MADALSTAFYLLGAEGAAAYTAEHPEVGVVMVRGGPAGRASHMFSSSAWARVISSRRITRYTDGWSKRCVTPGGYLVHVPILPGFLAMLFVVLLRIAIGWHFLHEGCEKVKSTYFGGKEPFSAEIYLRNANGPFAPYFRQMIPDVDSLAQLDPDHLKAEWTADVTRITAHFGFDADQQKKAQTILEENLQWATYWFNEPANAEKLKKYEHDVSQMERTERNPESLSYETDRATRRTAASRPTAEHWSRPWSSTGKSCGTRSPSWWRRPISWLPRAQRAPMTSLDVINRLTMFGLVAIGAA